MTNRKPLVYLFLTLAAILALASVLSGCGPAVVAAQNTAPEANTPRTLTVLGRGNASAAPDLGAISVGVETLAANVADASAQNNTKMAAIMAKLKELGIADKDIQTSNFSINSERQPGLNGPEGTTNYRVSNMVTIKIHDLSKVGSTLDAVIAAGANQVWGVNFTLEDTTALEAQARSKAIDDAKARAEALAKLNGVTVGEVLTINESNTGGGPIIPAAAAMGKGADSTSLNPGEVQFNSQVQVTFAIK